MPPFDSLGFPFSEDRGICRALDDPAVWNAAFKEADFRHDVKRAARRGLGQTKAWRVNDDSVFGATCIALLKTPRGREALERASLRLPLIGLLVLSHHAIHSTSLMNRLDTCLDPHPQAGEPPQLNTDRFDKWLDELPLDNSNAKSWSEIAAAFALRQPTDASKIVTALLRVNDALFAPLLTNSEVTAPAIANSIPASAQHDKLAETKHEQEDPEPAVPPPIKRAATDLKESAKVSVPFWSVDELSAELRRSRNERTVDEVRKIWSAVQEWEAETEARLRQLDQQRQRTREHLNELATMPWLEVPFIPEAVLPPQAEGTIDVELERWQRLEQDFSRVLEAHWRLQEVSDRLGQVPAPFIPATAFTPADITTYLAEETKRRQHQLVHLNAVVEQAQALLDQLAASDVGSAARLVAEAPATAWGAIGRLLVDSRLQSKGDLRSEKLFGDCGLAGLVLAWLLVQDPQAAQEFVAEAFAAGAAAQRSRRNAAELFAWVNFGDLPLLAHVSDKAAAAIAEIVFGHAISTDRLEVLEYLDGVLRARPIGGASGAFYQSIVEAARQQRIASLSETLQQVLTERPAEPTQNAAEKQWESVIALLDEQPRMSGYYHKLRVFAHLQFMEPLRDAIVTRQAAAALRTWQEHGDLDDMVDAAVRAVGEVRGFERISARHREQTRRYLQAFQTELTRWERLDSARAPRKDETLTAAFRHLAEQAVGGRDGEAAELLATIREGASRLGLSPDFGERRGTGERIAVSAEAVGLWLGPTMLVSWPAALSAGEVEIPMLLADALRARLTDEPVTVRQAVATYIESGLYEAAARGAGEDTELQAQVSAAAKRRREALASEHAELIAAAQPARALDADINECLQEIDRACERFDFAMAIELYRLLEDLTQEFQRRSDPERRMLREFLQAVGEAVDPNASVEPLRAAVESTRLRYRDRRVHLAMLKTASEDAHANASVRASWQTTAQRLDYPTQWPTENVARDLAESIDTIWRWMRGKLRQPEHLTHGTGMLLDRLAEWVPGQVAAAVADSAGSAARDSLIGLALEMADFCSEAQVLHWIGAAPAIATPPLSRRVDEVILASSEEPPAPSLPPPSPPPQVPDLIIRLRELIATGLAADNPSFAELRTAGAAMAWADVRAIACGLARTTNDASVTMDLLAVYGVATERDSHASVPLDSVARQEVCLALASSRRAATYLGKEIVKDYLPQVITKTVGSSTADSPVDDSIGEALQRAADLPAEDARFQWIADLFRRASVFRDEKEQPLSARLARQLWDQFTGIGDNARSRAALLRLLFRNRQLEALGELARLSPLVDLVRTALHAFEVAEGDPEARPIALQLSAALRLQAQGRPNTQPWILLFHSLESAREGAEAAALTVELDSEFVGRATDGSPTIEVRLRPSLFDPPGRLELLLDKAPALPLLSDPLFTERSFIVPLPPATEFSPEGEGRVTWQVRGRTAVQDAAIDVRGTWNLHLQPQNPPMNAEIIRIAWPGATMEPVNRASGFFGRQAEIRRIEDYVRAPIRMRSVMVFGERRIGKTSLLKEIISTLPPVPGGPCGAFCDVSDLRFTGDQSIAATFFQGLLTALNVRGDNRPLLDVLERSQNHAVDIPRIAKGINPDVSFYACLEMFAQRLEAQSRGAITKLVLVIDEFDRFVDPLVRGRREEVGTFLWSLRQVVQRSERICLILAGSGLQRLLMENYQDALHGSIDQVELPRFSWSEDRTAITDIFLPELVRENLCRAEDVERVAERAAEWCGGHPMYLALLGSAAAHLSEGRRFTPGFVDAVVEQLVRENGRGPVQVQRNVFYQHVFESLAILDSRERTLAKALLASIAQHTLPDPRFAWLANSRAFEVSGLLSYASNRQLLDCLARLAEAQAIFLDKAGGRVRISVPIRAAALREDALALRETALLELEALGGAAA